MKTVWVLNNVAPMEGQYIEGLFSDYAEACLAAIQLSRAARTDVLPSDWAWNGGAYAPHGNRAKEHFTVVKYEVDTWTVHDD